MANWSDPRPTAAPFAAATAREASYDAGLRAYMLSVYNYMTSGILLTGIVAMLFSYGGATSPAYTLLHAGRPARLDRHARAARDRVRDELRSGALVDRHAAAALSGASRC